MGYFLMINSEKKTHRKSTDEEKKLQEEDEHL